VKTKNHIQGSQLGLEAMGYKKGKLSEKPVGETSPKVKIANTMKSVDPEEALKGEFL